MLGAESAVDIVEISPERVEIRGAEKSPESAPHDTLRFRQISPSEWSYSCAHLLLRVTSAPGTFPRPAVSRLVGNGAALSTPVVTIHRFGKGPKRSGIKPLIAHDCISF